MDFIGCVVWSSTKIDRFRRSRQFTAFAIATWPSPQNIPILLNCHGGIVYGNNN